jgi:hypothetical protein
MRRKAIEPEAIKPKPVVEVAVREGVNVDDVTAATLTKPEVQAAITMQQWESRHDVSALVKALSLQVDDVTNGNMQRPEAMLLMQAHTLDQLFNILAQRAYRRDTVTSCEIHLRLAFKAQAQCRSTLETLAAIKNPPVIFAKQANISNNQQINNGVPAQASHAEEIKNQQNELLVEAQYGSTTMDINTAGKAIPVNSHLEAVDKSRS